MIRDVCREMYRIARDNMEKEGQGAAMPVSEEVFMIMADHEDPYVIDLAPVVDLPPLDYTNALYALFHNGTNDQPEYWRRLAEALSEDEFKKSVTNAFMGCEQVEKYHIQVINNPYGQKGSRLARLLTKARK